MTKGTFTFIFLLAMMAIIVASPTQVIVVAQGMVLFVLGLVGSLLSSWFGILFGVAVVAIVIIGRFK